MSMEKYFKHLLCRLSVNCLPPKIEVFGIYITIGVLASTPNGYKVYTNEMYSTNIIMNGIEQT